MRYMVSVMNFWKNDHVKGIAISLWTLVQTLFHVLWVAVGYSFYWCTIKPSNYLVLLVHLTYFYNHDCGSIAVTDDYDIFSMKNKWKVLPLDSNITDEDYSVQNIVFTIVKKGAFPEESAEARRTQLYIFTYIISDGIWIITSLLLFAGICCRVKKCLSLIFYGPWLISTPCICLLDVVAAVHFGLDYLQVQNYTSWLKFMGIKNYKDFTKFDEFESSSYIPQESVTLMVTLFSRMVLFWILNIIGFFHIINMATLAYQDDAVLGNGKRANRRPNLNTSDSRIRNWQLFYGALETTNRSLSENSNLSHEMDPNYNSQSRNGINSTVRPVAGASHFLESLDSNIACISSILDSPKPDNGSGEYRRYSVVSENLGPRSLRKGSLDSLRSQLPWSYIPSTTSEGSTFDLAAGTSLRRSGQDLTKSNIASTAL